MQALKMHRAVMALLLCSCTTLANAGFEPLPPGDAQKKAEQEMCAQTICQKNVRVTLKQKDGSIFDQTFAVLPAVVQSFGVLVMAGQTVNLEADLINGDLKNIHSVETIVHPEKTLTIKLVQMDDGGMMLSTTNPFPEALKFNMGIMPLESDRLLKTSSCPVLKGSFETWPYPIFQVVLGGGHVVAAENSVCD
jgi:hypothetical protein